MNEFYYQKPAPIFLLSLMEKEAKFYVFSDLGFDWMLISLWKRIYFFTLW